MSDLNITNFKFKKNINDYIFIFELNHDKYVIKRISKDSEIIIINIFNNLVEFNCIRNRTRVYNLDLLEKDNIINNIIDTLKKVILLDFVNFDELSNIIKETYFNIVYLNNNLGLSVINNNLINIILLKTNSIIGNIKIDYDVKITVDKIYLKESLELLEKYLNSKKEKKLIKK